MAVQTVIRRDKANVIGNNMLQGKRIKTGSKIWVRKQYVNELKGDIGEASSKRSSSDMADMLVVPNGYVCCQRRYIVKLQQDRRNAKDRVQRLRLRFNPRPYKSSDIGKKETAPGQVSTTPPGSPPKRNAFAIRTHPPSHPRLGKRSSGHGNIFKEHLARALGLGKLLKRYPYSSSGSEPTELFTESEIERLKEVFQAVNEEAAELWPTERFRSLKTKPEILRKVGRGSYGEIHLCKKTPSSKVVVVKRSVFDEKAILDLRGRAAKIEHCLHRVDIFCKELRAFETLKSDTHPTDLANIVAYHGYGEWVNDAGPNHRHLYLEHCDGDLVSQLSGGMRITQAEDLKILIDVMRGLSTIHKHGILHQDIKPDNILFTLYRTPSGKMRRTWKICDFGLASFKDDNGEYQFTGGSLPYMSPERFTQGRLPDEKIDVWAAYVTWLESRYKISDGHEYEHGSDEGHYDWKKRYQDVISAAKNDGLYPTRDPGSLGYFLALLAGCDPVKRPSADEVLARLTKESGLMGMLAGREA